MLLSISIRNFQAHKDSKLEFHPGVNAITGQSDRGKSSIIRAVRLVHENRPAGSSYRSHFAGKRNTDITVTVPEGSTSRVRGPKDNYYQVGEKNLTAIGQKVPEEVSNLLDMRPVNFQYQMDRPFLLDLHPSKLAQYLNEEIGLDIIDRATSNIRKRILRNTEEIQRLESLKKELGEKLKGFQNLPTLEGMLAGAEYTEQTLRQFQKNHKSLAQILSSINDSQTEQKKYQSILNNAVSKKDAADDLEKQWKKCLAREQLLQDCLSSVQEEQQIVLIASRTIKTMKDLPVLQDLYREWKADQERGEALKETIRHIQQDQRNLLISKKQKELAYETYQAAIPESCPTCGQTWPRNKSL